MVEALPKATDHPFKGLGSPEAKAFATVVLILTLLVSALYCGSFAKGHTISICNALEHYDSFFAREPGHYQFKYEYDASLFLSHLPFEKFVRENYLKGIIPLWNDRIGCGFSLVGDIQGRIFAPLTLLISSGNQRIYNFRLVLELLIGAVGMAALCRQAVSSKLLICLFAGATFLLSPQMFSQHELPNNYWMYPWIMLSLRSAIQAGGAFRVVLCVLVLAFSIASGHCECMFFAISFASLFALLPDSMSRDEAIRSFKIRLLRLTLLGALTFAICAPIILPFLEFCSNSYVYKSDEPTPWHNNIFFFLGSLSRPLSGIKSPFLGPLAGALALPMFFCKQTRSIFTVAIFSLVFVTRVFPFRLLFEAQPLCGLYPLYAIPIFTIMIILLSCGTLAELADARVRRNAVFSLFSAGVWFVVPHAVLEQLWKLQPGQADISADPDYYPGIALAAIVFSILLLRRKQKSHWITPLSLVVANSIGLLLSGQAVMPVREQLISPQDSTIKYLQKQDERALGLGDAFLEPNLLSAFSIRDFNLFEPQVPKRYRSYADIAGVKRRYVFYSSYAPPISDLLSMASVRYLLVSTDATAFAIQPSDKIRLVMRSPRVELLENKLSLPQAYLVHNVIPVSGLAEAKIALAKNSEQASQGKVAIIESPHSNSPAMLSGIAPKGALAAGSPSLVQGFKVQRLNCNKVSINTATTADGFLILTDSYYPGWVARVDGKEVPIFATNVLFRGIALPPGNHAVIFEYCPKSFDLGAILSALCVLGLMGLLVYELFSKSRRGLMPVKASNGN